MWVIVLFDLPTKTTTDRREYGNFRKNLMASGFFRMQYSVYARYVPSPEKGDTIQQRVVSALPADGEVRMFRLTDNQYSRMQVFEKKAVRRAERPPEQLSFF